MCQRALVIQHHVDYGDLTQNYMRKEIGPSIEDYSHRRQKKHDSDTMSHVSCHDTSDHRRATKLSDRQDMEGMAGSPYLC